MSHPANHENENFVEPEKMDYRKLLKDWLIATRQIHFMLDLCKFDMMKLSEEQCVEMGSLVDELKAEGRL